MRSWRIGLGALGSVAGICLLWAGCSSDSSSDSGGSDNVHCEIRHRNALVACYHAGTSELNCASAYGSGTDDPFQYIKGSGDCPAGHALSCEDEDHTEFYYDANDGTTCEQYESHEAAVYATAYTCKVYETAGPNIGDLVACFATTQEFGDTECASTAGTNVSDTRDYVFEVGTCPLTNPAATLICPAHSLGAAPTTITADQGVLYIYTSTTGTADDAVTCDDLDTKRATHEG